MDEGIKIDRIWLHCPVLAEGTIDGEPFYFKARGWHWWVEIGSEDNLWEYSEPYGEPYGYDAGWMDYELVPGFVEKAASNWRLRSRPS